MRDAVANGRVAGTAAADRPDLWLPGALAWVAVGWIPFTLTVARLPTQGEVTFFGGRMFTSGAWPFNAIAIVVGIVVAVLLLVAIAALGEAALERRMIAADGRIEPTLAASSRMMGVLLLAATPAVIVGAGMGLRLAAVAANEFRSPDIGGDVAVRLLGHAAPFLVLLAVAILAGQAWGAAAARRVIAGGMLRDASHGAFADLRRGARRLPLVAVGSMIVSVAYAVAVWGLLRILWAPIEARLRGGSGIAADGIPLLVGFIAIWLCLVLGGGAVHAWASAWWSLELADVRDVMGPARTGGAAGP